MSKVENIDYEFVLNEDYNICIVFNNGCSRICPILSVDFKTNCLEIDNDKKISFPVLAHARYLRMTKIVTTLKVFHSLKRLLDESD